MKTYFAIIFFVASSLTGYAQGNHVFSGGEMVNHSVLNIPAGTQLWSTDRAAVPGYFSAVNTANFTGCTDAAHINGYIKKYGNTAFIFPVGSGYALRTLAISSPAAITDAYAAAWIAGDPGTTTDPTTPNAGFHSVNAVKAPIVAVSTAGQWDWQTGEAGNLGAGTSGTGEGLTITVSIPDMSAIASAASLRLVGWDGTQWIDLSGAATASGNTENSTLSGTMVAGITAIAIGIASSALPVTLEYFAAASSNCNAALTWRTSNEINFKQFIIEQSIDQVNFSPVATVPARNTTTVNNYSLEVAQPSGVAFYRLKMMNIDGVYTYSQIVKCHTSCAISGYMIIYPNPVVATGTVNLSFSTPYKGKAMLIITNMLGQRFSAKPIVVTGGVNLVPTDVSRFASGTYLMSLLTDAGERIGSVQKFIKQ